MAVVAEMFGLPDCGLVSKETLIFHLLIRVSAFADWHSQFLEYLFYNPFQL